MGQPTLLQLVKVDFQWFGDLGGLRGLLHVPDGLHGHFHLRGPVRLTILNTNSQKSMLKTPQIKLTTSQFFGDVIVGKSTFR